MLRHDMYDVCLIAIIGCAVTLDILIILTTTASNTIDPTVRKTLW